jgi:hypothetical protein
VVDAPLGAALSQRPFIRLLADNSKMNAALSRHRSPFGSAALMRTSEQMHENRVLCVGEGSSTGVRLTAAGSVMTITTPSGAHNLIMLVKIIGSDTITPEAMHQGVHDVLEHIEQGKYGDPPGAEMAVVSLGPGSTL